MYTEYLLYNALGGEAALSSWIKWFSFLDKVIHSSQDGFSGQGGPSHSKSKLEIFRGAVVLNDFYFISRYLRLL